MPDVVRVSHTVQNANTTNLLRYNADYERLGMGFLAPRAIGTVSKVTLSLKKTGSPTGNIFVEIQTNASGAPSNTIVTNGTSANVDVSTLTTSFSFTYDFTFATPPTLTAGTTYHIVLKGDYLVSTINYASWENDQNGTYADGNGYRFNGSTWFGPITDFDFKVWGDPIKGGAFLMNLI